MTPTLPSRLAESGAKIKALFRRDRLPETLVILGSGFKGFERQLQDATSVDVGQIIHFPVPRVEGHGGALVIGTAGEAGEIAVLTGRAHMYEGHSPQAVVFPLRALAMLGVKRVLLTNAAGSVDEKIVPGQVVLVHDQLNLTGRSCLELPSDEGAKPLGPMFVDMGEAFDVAWRQKIAKVAAVTPGIYAGVLGPAYETPAEARMLRVLGAHVVGMSTVQEVLAARELGLKVACLSFVTNMSGGLGQPLSHADVIDLVARHQSGLHQLIVKAVSEGKSL